MTPRLTTSTWFVPPYVTSWALFSDDGDYRYALGRQWDEGKPTLVWIGMNPSAAMTNTDDRSVRKLFRYAERQGYGTLLVFNAYAYRSTDPKGMRAVADPVGLENDSRLEHTLQARAAETPIVVLAGWGVIAAARHNALVALLDRVTANVVLALRCFGRTQAGYPRHPLYASLARTYPFALESIP